MYSRTLKIESVCFFSFWNFRSDSIMAFNFQTPVEWNDLVQNQKHQTHPNPNFPFNINPLSMESNGWSPQFNNSNNAILALPPPGFEISTQLQTPKPSWRREDPPRFTKLPISNPNTPSLNSADQSTWPKNLKDFVSDLRGLTNTKFGLQIPTLVRDYNNLQRSNNNLPPSIEKIIWFLRYSVFTVII